MAAALGSLSARFRRVTHRTLNQKVNILSVSISKISLPLLCALFSTVACLPHRTDYIGIWKSSCTDYWGVQIKHVDSRLYSVSFCGYGGCFEPGTWQPDSQIEDDPTYQVMSPQEIRIGRRDDSTYVKCSSDPTWLSHEPEQPRTTISEPVCLPGPPLPRSDVLIGWATDVWELSPLGQTASPPIKTIVKPFRALAILRGDAIAETDGSSIRTGARFWRALSPQARFVRLGSVESFLDHSDGQCVYSGDFDGDAPLRWTLLTSRPLRGIFRAPTAQQRAAFYDRNTTCVIQGDYLPDEHPSCTRPVLLAVTDLDRDGIVEYWATEPYMWDTGVTAWRDGPQLTSLLSVCPGCSD